MLKIKINKKIIINSLLIIAVIIILYLLIRRFPIFVDLATVIIISFIISYSLRPYYKFLMNKGVNSKVAAIISLLTIILGIILIFTVLIPSVFEESENIGGMVNMIEEYINKIKNFETPIGNNEYVGSFLNSIYDKFQVFIKSVSLNIIEKVISIGENVLIFLISPTVIYFFLCDDNLILSGALKFIPNTERPALRKTLIHIDKVLERYIITQFELCGIIGVLTFLVLIMLDVKFPILLSLINAIFNIIPYFGPVIGAVPIMILASIGSIKTGIYVFIALIIIQQVEGDIISPKIIGDSVNAHPLTILILLLIGGNVGGILGMIIIVPIWVIIKVLHEDLEAYLF